MKAARPFFASLDEQGLQQRSSRMYGQAVLANGRQDGLPASDAYQKVLLQTGHLKQAVALRHGLHQRLPARLEVRQAELEREVQS